MNRDSALQSVRQNIKNENLVRHMLATEAIMRALAKRFNENEDEWGLAGLLHDIDLELLGDDYDRSQQTQCGNGQRPWRERRRLPCHPLP